MTEEADRSHRKEAKMFAITSYSAELIKDPFAILTGERYEFLLEIEVQEDDDLFSENGLNLRVIYLVEEGKTGILSYEFLDRLTEQYYDFELEDAELAEVSAFCKEHYEGAGD